MIPISFQINLALPEHQLRPFHSHPFRATRYKCQTRFATYLLTWLVPNRLGWRGRWPESDHIRSDIGYEPKSADDVHVCDRSFVFDWKPKRHILLAVQSLAESEIDTIKGHRPLLMVYRDVV
jgi:hypothetical protein